MNNNQEGPNDFYSFIDWYVNLMQLSMDVYEIRLWLKVNEINYQPNDMTNEEEKG